MAHVGVVASWQRLLSLNGQVKGIGLELLAACCPLPALGGDTVFAPWAVQTNWTKIQKTVVTNIPTG